MITGTLCSRILGLIRDSVFFALLGSSMYASSFLFAFSIPNLFRRLWGEGALSSAFIPVFSENYVKNKTKVWLFLNAFLTRFGLFLAAFITVSVAVLFAIKVFVSSNQFVIGLDLTISMLPYMWFICLAAILNGALNVLNAFKICAFAPVILNVAMIASLLLGHIMHFSLAKQVYMLSASVIGAGVIQCAMPWLWLKKISNWNPSFNILPNNDLAKVWSLFLPGLFGAAIFQINAFFGRFLAFFIDEKAVSILYLANRFLELPLGLFAFSIVTVILPKLSLHQAKDDKTSIINTYNQGVSLLLTILMPAAIGIIVLAKPVLQLFFQWGKFSSNDIALTIPVLQIFAVGLPLYGISSLLTRVFHSQQDTKTPVNIAFISFLIYVLMALLTMFKFKAIGLALSSLTSVAVQCALLYKKLVKRHAIYSLTKLLPNILKWIASTAIMGMVLKLIYLTININCCNKLSLVTSLTLLVTLSASLYSILLLILDTKSAKLWLSLLKK